MIRFRKEEKWIIYIFITLLCLVLTSFWLMCNIYARYTSEASGSDGARVARFDITQSGEATSRIKVNVYPGYSQSYKVSVTNRSEVAVEYAMEIKNTYGNLPLEFKMLDDQGNEISTKSIDVSAQDRTEHSYQLNISWPDGVDAAYSSAKSPDYAGKTDVVEIILKAVQID